MHVAHFYFDDSALATLPMLMFVCVYYGIRLVQFDPTQKHSWWSHIDAVFLHVSALSRLRLVREPLQLSVASTIVRTLVNRVQVLAVAVFLIFPSDPRPIC